jgi:hypothetical protein
MHYNNEHSKYDPNDFRSKDNKEMERARASPCSRPLVEEVVPTTTKSKPMATASPTTSATTSTKASQAATKPWAINYQGYQKMKQMLMQHLTDNEMTTSENTEEELVEWYMKQTREDVDVVTDDDEGRRRVRTIITRLIVNETIMMVVDPVKRTVRTRT